MYPRVGPSELSLASITQPVQNLYHGQEEHVRPSLETNLRTNGNFWLCSGELCVGVCECVCVGGDAHCIVLGGSRIISRCTCPHTHW